MTWVFLVLAYGVIKGFREIFKKKALKKNSTIEVLFLYTFISFLIVIPFGKDALIVPTSTLMWVAVKSFTIFLAWIFGFKAIEHMPVSLYGIIDLSRVLFSTALGILIIGESVRLGQMIGLVLVVIGLLLLKIKKKPQINSTTNVKTTDSTSFFFVLLAFFSALLNGLSGTMDKMLLAPGNKLGAEISDNHLQFWYMLFLVLYYLLYILVMLALNKTSKSENKFKFHLVSALKNYWIWILAIIFVIADKCLFIANKDPNSTVTVMTLIKQSSCIVTIVAGKLIFHEKNIAHKLMCAAIIITGIVISVLFK